MAANERNIVSQNDLCSISDRARHFLMDAGNRTLGCDSQNIINQRASFRGCGRRYPWFVLIDQGAALQLLIMLETERTQ